MDKQVENSQESQKLPSFSGCFVCGRDNPKGLHAEFLFDGSSVRAAFIPDKSVLGYGHAVHGGIISTLLDEAIIWAAYSHKNRFGVTAELNVRFIEPLTIEKKCIIEAQLTEDKGKIWIVEAKIYDQDGTLYAKAKGKVVPMSTDQNEEMKRYLSNGNGIRNG
jgi:uncharacterized protein (TIGR00369 family)